MEKFKGIEGGVTAAKGFLAADTAAGIKYKDRTDMAMIYSQKDCKLAGTFTTNVVKAAPVLWDRERVESGKPGRAVVVNAGIANACTGKEGMGYCEETAKACCGILNEVILKDSGEELGPEQILVASTGVIGMQLPIDRICGGIAAMAPALKPGRESGAKAARAIMTTDTKPKEAAVEVILGGKIATIGGMCKGSGMIHPNMCTMLAFITTDAVIGQETLQKALSEDVQDTYNMISVDGDTSTNDTVLLLANGLAGNPEIRYGTPEYETFAGALHAINEYLAKKIAGDGEGATALLEARVEGCENREQAKTLAKSIVCSNLTKTAIAGHDANWGRILCAMGYSGAQFDPENVDLFFESKAGKIQIIENGTALPYSETEAAKILSQPEVTVIADVKMGEAGAAAWGCDLTHGYIDINADYRS